jgi:hypothetical protein
MVLADTTDTGTAIRLADAVAGLQPTDEERNRTYQAPITLLGDVNMNQDQAARQLTYAGDHVAPTAGILRLMREGLLSALTETTDSWKAIQRAETVVGLQPTPKNIARCARARSQCCLLPLAPGVRLRSP